MAYRKKTFVCLVVALLVFLDVLPGVAYASDGSRIGQDGVPDWAVGQRAVASWDGAGNPMAYGDAIGLASSGHLMLGFGGDASTAYAMASDAGLVDIIAVYDWLVPEGVSEPDGIRAQLLRDGEPHGDPVVLDAAGNWQYYWRDLDGSHAWAVERVDNIPAEYMWYDTSSGEYTDESGETPHEYVVYGTTAIHGDFGSCDEWELPLSIRKVWFGDSGNRPEDVSVDFSANLPTDMHIDETISLNESNNWLWRNLFKGIGAVYGRYVGEHLPIGWESIVVDVHVHGLMWYKKS